MEGKSSKRGASDAPALVNKPASTQPRGFSGTSLAKAIFKAELPDNIIQSLPAQSLYIAAKQNGLGSSSDLIEAVTIEQGRLMLDFDLWEKDEFNEDNLWDWLAMTDASNDLDTLQKILKFLDLKLVSAVISRHVTYVINNNASEASPGEGYYTPDKGNTWLRVECGDEDKNFLLARLLAMIFETSAELFYQLLSVSSTHTSSLLVEEAYQDRARRLSSEAVPDAERSFELNSPYPLGQALKDLAAGEKRRQITDVPIIEPLVFDAGQLEPLSALMLKLGRREDLEAELTLVMNAAIVFHNVPFYDLELVNNLVGKVKGTLNIGLEMLSAAGQPSLDAAVELLGLSRVYRLGKGKLRELHTAAQKISEDIARQYVNDSAQFMLLAGAKESYPELPNCFDRNGNLIHDDDGKLRPGYRPIEHLDEIEWAISKLR